MADGRQPPPDCVSQAFRASRLLGSPRNSASASRPCALPPPSSRAATSRPCQARPTTDALPHRDGEEAFVSADVRPNPVILLAGSTVIAGILMVAGAEVDARTFLLHHRGACRPNYPISASISMGFGCNGATPIAIVSASRSSCGWRLRAPQQGF